MTGSGRRIRRAAGSVDGITVQQSLSQNQGNAGFVSHVLVNGHSLLAVNNVLQVADVAVLASNHNGVGAGVVGLDSLRNTSGGGVVGAQSDVEGLLLPPALIPLVYVWLTTTKLAAVDSFRLFMTAKVLLAGIELLPLVPEVILFQ